MFGNVPESTKMYQEGPKKCQKYQMYVKVREEVPKTTKSTKKFKNVWESTKLYQEVPKKCQKVPKRNKTAKRYHK